MIDTIYDKIQEVEHKNIEPKYLIVDYGTLKEIRMLEEFSCQGYEKEACTALGDSILGLYILVIQNNNITHLEVR